MFNSLRLFRGKWAFSKMDPARENKAQSILSLQYGFQTDFKAEWPKAISWWVPGHRDRQVFDVQGSQSWSMFNNSARGKASQGGEGVDKIKF